MQVYSTIFMVEKSKEIGISQILENGFVCFIYMSKF